MPLSEDRRRQLDGIVAKMEDAGESEDDIRFVVKDFKKIHGNYQAGQESAPSPSPSPAAAKPPPLAGGPLKPPTEGFLQSRARMLFPQTVKGFEEGSFEKPGGFAAASMSAAGDIVDIPRRAYMAGKSALTGQGNEAAAAQAQRPPEGVLEKIVGEAPLMLTPTGAGRSLVAKGAELLGGALKRPVAKGVEKTAQAVTGRVIESAPSTAIHQGERVAQGEEASGGAAAAEVGLSVAVPGVLQGGGKLLKDKAKQIVQTVTKKGGKAMTEEQAERLLTEYGSMRGLKTINQKVEAAHANLSKEFEELFKTSGKRVNIRGALAQAEHKLDAMEAAAAIDLDDAVIARTKIEQWKAQAEKFTDEAGWADFDKAQNFKRNTLDNKAKWAVDNPAGSQQAARMSRREIANQMALKEPKLAELNEKFGPMAELEPFVDAALMRSAANRGLSLQDIISLAAGIGIGTGAAFSDSKGVGALGVLPLLISRGQKSPGAATALHRIGRTGDFTGRQIGRQGVLQPIRSGLFSPSEEER